MAQYKVEEADKIVSDFLIFASLTFSLHNRRDSQEAIKDRTSFIHGNC